MSRHPWLICAIMWFLTVCMLAGYFSAEYSNAVEREMDRFADKPIK